jgi:hypothetical protein
VTLDTGLSMAGIVWEAAVLIFLVRRQVYKILPVFCTYIAWTFASDIASSLIFNFAPASYYRYYLVEMTIDSLLQFTVLVELAWSVLRPIRSSLPRATLYVLAVLIAVAGLVIWPLVAQTVPLKLTAQGALLFHLQETFAILRIVCFLVMASFSQLLSIGWRDRELQVATGLGVYSIVSLVVLLLHSHQQGAHQFEFAISYHQLDLAVPISYLGTLSYWVLSFSAKEQKRKEFSPQMQQFLLLMSGGVRAGRIALSDLPSERLRKKD